MIGKKSLKYLPGALFAIAVAASSMGGCAAAKDAANAGKGCDGLDVSASAQATVKAYADAAAKLNAKAVEVEGKFLTVCNAMNADLKLDTTKTTAAEACGVLKARVDAAAAKGVTVTVSIEASCTADVHAQASCEGDCNAKATCDVKAKCEPGKVVVECNGSCDAQCDVQAPAFDCTGSCEGTCTATAAVACTGQCEGTCDAPKFDGTCDVGCEAMFSGTCGGMCTGKCDGMDTTGMCNGKCEGTCSAKASGHCEAACKGKLTGGCTGMCTGSCTAQAGAMCTGKCNGKCSYMPGAAMCKGECHGMCSAEVSPPQCTGSLDCQASASCRANCTGSASANVTCDKPHATVVVAGDLELQAALEAHIADWGEAVNLIIALKDPVATFAGQTLATFQAAGDIGISGAACVASSLSVAAEASAHVNVSVSASASLSGKASSM